MQDKILGYKFTPVYKSELSGMQVCSSTVCPVMRTGLHGYGNRKDIYSEEFKNACEDKLLAGKIRNLIIQERSK